MLSVRVAVYGRQFSSFLLEGPGAPAGVPYEQRPSVVVEAVREDMLADVLDRAAHRLGYQLREPTEHDDMRYWPRRLVDAIAFVDFYDGTDEAWPRTGLTVLDAEGHAVWNQPWQRVTMGDLLDASAAGLIAGDVLSPYFIPQESAGAFDGVDWSALLDVLDQAHHYLKAVSDVTGEVTTVAAAVTLGRKVIQRARERWQRRGGTPHDVSSLVASKRDKVEQLGHLLDVSTEDADALVGLVTGNGMDLGGAVWDVILTGLSSGLADPAYDRKLLHDATREALDYVAGGGRRQVEIQAIFGRKVNPDWDKLNAHLWEPPL